MKITLAGKHITNHMKGRPTKVSRLVMGKVESALKEAGYKPPFHIRRIMLTSNENGNYFFGGIYYM